jgi:chemotaxis signal transduction protein
MAGRDDTAKTYGKALLVPARLCNTQDSLYFLFSPAQVEEVRNEMTVYPVPFAPQHVKGISVLRDHLLPVLELEKLFGFETASESSSERYIAIRSAVSKRNGPELLRCVVYASSGIRFLSLPIACHPEKPEGSLLKSGDSFVRGFYRLEEGGNIVAADMGAILQGMSVTSEEFGKELKK